MDDGEEAKTLATVEDLCRRFAAWGLLRGDAVVALGGGVVGDTAGFAAATYHRGVAVLQAPTTLLAMVDAAIGGKTAVNLPEGKNLVGAFHQPVGVVADTDTLATLPEREYRSGLGEVAKYALLGDVVADPSGLVELLRLETTAVLARDPAVLGDLVDPLRRDQGRRRGPRSRGAHRAAGHAEPRPHVRPRARDRGRLRPDPRRGRRDRSRVRGRARRRLRAGRPRRRRPLPGGAGDARPRRPRSRAARRWTPTSCSRSCAGTRRRAAGSRSCSRARTASSGSTIRPSTRCGTRSHVRRTSES